MVARQCRVDRIAIDHPGDTSGLQALIDAGTVQPGDIVAVFGKTEGNGCVNDFSRPLAVMALGALLAQQTPGSGPGVANAIPIIISGGTEGGLSPHLLVFSVTAAATEPPPPASPSLAIGTTLTRALLPEEIGRWAQVQQTALGVRAAMLQAGITDPADVHYVQVKCPLLTSLRIAEAHARGTDVVTTDTYGSMAYSRGASALGVAIALGEVDDDERIAPAICRDFSLWSGRAGTSAGIELTRNEIVVLGNSGHWASDVSISHAVMRDAIDTGAIHDALGRLGIVATGQLHIADAARICAVLAKAEPSRSGTIRGSRHIMWDDSDINATRHARALVGGVIAGTLGQTDLFVSGGAEHQGPDGGGPVAIIARNR